MSTSSGRRALAKRWLGFVAFAFSLVFASSSWAAFVPPPIDGHVTDPGHKLDPQTKADLEAKLEAFRVATTDEVAVLVAPSLGGETIEDVAYATFNTWKIGLAGKDNGVLATPIADRALAELL